MVASTDIKFFLHTNNNAPQLQNAYGSMIDVLDACLVDGIQIGIANSLTANDDEITLSFSTNHNLMQYQVIKINGANQDEFNGEHRIINIPSATTAVFRLNQRPTVTQASGTISVSLPSLGWEKPFSSSNSNGGGKAAYRSTNLLLPSRPFLRVVDELDPAWNVAYAKYAKVGIVEDMSSIDDLSALQAPFDSVLPDRNWIGTGSGTSAYNGWAKWYYARMLNNASRADTGALDTGVRSYIVIGSLDAFYILPASSNSTTNAVVYGFGALNGLIDGDNTANFLLSTLRYHTASTSYSYAASTPAASTATTGVILQRNIEQDLMYGLGGVTSIAIPGATNINSGASNYIESVTSNQNILSCPAFVYEFSNTSNTTIKAIRGELPLLNWLFQEKPYSHATPISVDDIFYIPVTVYPLGTGEGQVLFKVGSANG